MHGQPRLHVRIGNCTPRGIWVCRAAKWETPEQLGLHSQCTNISTLRRKWKQEGGGAEGEASADSSFTQNISPPRIVWKIREVNASCLMENKGSNLKPSASNTCTLSRHLSVSVSWLILKHNPFEAPTCHNISILPIQDNFRWLQPEHECFISTSQTVDRKRRRRFDSLWICLYLKRHRWSGAAPVGLDGHRWTTVSPHITVCCVWMSKQKQTKALNRLFP